MTAVLVEHRYHVSDRVFYIVECRDCLAVLNSGHHYFDRPLAQELAATHNDANHPDAVTD